MSDIVYLLPVGYDPKHPISTGPWKFVSFQPGKQTVLDRFENYHGTPAYADRLLIVRHGVVLGSGERVRVVGRTIRLDRTSYRGGFAPIPNAAPVLRT